VASLDALIDKLRNTPESTVVQYADAVVKVHLAEAEQAGGQS
jgi:hypothetical protein